MGRESININRMRITIEVASLRLPEATANLSQSQAGRLEVTDKLTVRTGARRRTIGSGSNSITINKVVTRTRLYQPRIMHIEASHDVAPAIVGSPKNTS